ncbi:MAG: 16S rRNA (guanine(527)-N(7))-methyltransferase RsmG [Desulfobulbaceae bacterium DB1]|nr:MAG: 16S rRNA (guanine(527)-N(7))-methyltransferase RsmG [Desulfobulbaceae bacterium DB1]
MDSRDFLQEGCGELGIKLEKKAMDRLALYFQELCKWNRKMNLVAAAPDKELIESHFLDSLTLLPFLDTDENPSLLDVGTGAGFPGLALKCAVEPLALTLVEPREKRVTFLRHIVRQLGLTGVEILDHRLEKTNKGECRYPLITSRALSTVSEFLDLVTDWCPPGGTVICMKGPKADEEIAQWRTVSPASPFVLEKHQSLTLPFSGAARNLLVFRKNGLHQP